MNAQRRKQLENIISKLEELKNDIEMTRDAEQEAYDNLPEGLQVSFRGESIESAVGALDSAYDSIEDTINNLQEAIEY
ncbi:MAG: hypothetical protein ACK5KT_11270 [Dysgonomonas sp.]